MVVQEPGEAVEAMIEWCTTATREAWYRGEPEDDRHDPADPGRVDHLLAIRVECLFKRHEVQEMDEQSAAEVGRFFTALRLELSRPERLEGPMPALAHRSSGSSAMPQTLADEVVAWDVFMDVTGMVVAWLSSVIHSERNNTDEAGQVICPERVEWLMEIQRYTMAARRLSVLEHVVDAQRIKDFFVAVYHELERHDGE